MPGDRVGHADRGHRGDHHANGDDALAGRAPDRDLGADLTAPGLATCGWATCGGAARGWAISGWATRGWAISGWAIAVRCAVGTVRSVAVVLITGLSHTEHADPPSPWHNRWPPPCVPF